MPDDALTMDQGDAEVDALNKALGADADGYYARDMNGDVRYYSHPERYRCGGHGYTRCYCGGDLCVCGNDGEIECYGCCDCEGEDDA